MNKNVEIKEPKNIKKSKKKILFFTFLSFIILCLTLAGDYYLKIRDIILYDPEPLCNTKFFPFYLIYLMKASRLHYYTVLLSCLMKRTRLSLY